jgi:hypothetical protein
MRVVGLLPPPLHRRVARAMYQRRYFTAIVSNMPGPTAELSMAGAPIKDVYPILPLAEGVPLGVGTLGWAGQFCLSVITDAQRLPEADALVTGILQAIERMRLELPELPEQPELPGEAAADGGSDARAGGVREEVPTSPS